MKWYGQGMNLVACIIDTIEQNRDQCQSPNRWTKFTVEIK